jgi:hypothetical protein
MKISIDTSTDSKEEIRKAITLLQSIVEHEAHRRDIFSSPGVETYGGTPSSAPAEPANNPVSAFGALFGDNAPVVQQSSSLELPKEKKAVPQIEYY